MYSMYTSYNYRDVMSYFFETTWFPKLHCSNKYRIAEYFGDFGKFESIRQNFLNQNSSL